MKRSRHSRTIGRQTVASPALLPLPTLRVFSGHNRSSSKVLATDAGVHACGKAEAGRLHPYEEGKNRGEPVPERSVQRIVENLELYRVGRLVPNGLSEVRYGCRPLEVPA